MSTVAVPELQSTTELKNWKSQEYSTIEYMTALNAIDRGGILHFQVPVDFGRYGRASKVLQMTTLPLTLPGVLNA